MHLTGVLLLLTIITAALAISERLAGLGKISLVLSRKMVHVTAIAGVAVSPALFPNRLLLAVIIAVFIPVLFWAVATRRLAIDESRRRKSWGIALFPVAFLILLLAFGASKPWLVVYPMLVLATADAAAAVVGETIARRYFNLTGDRKSLPGSISFALVTVMVLFFLPPMLGSLHPVLAWPAATSGASRLQAILLIALLAAVAEALGSHGSDNLTVPFITAWAMQLAGSGFPVEEAGLVACFSVAVGLLAYRKRWLDAGGAVSAALLGMVVWAGGRWATAIPVLFFFVTGSLWSRLPRSAALSAGHGRPRNHLQVWANGGVGGLMLAMHLFHPHPAWLLAYLVSVAVCTADTWSSELGQWAGGRVIDILSLKPLPAGLSGGVSWQGSLAGLLGSACVAILGRLLMGLNVQQTLLIALFGISGMMVDSLVGSRFQARYRLSNGGFSEERPGGYSGPPEKGFAVINNDAVNLLSALALTLAALMIGFWAG